MCVNQKYLLPHLNLYFKRDTYIYAYEYYRSAQKRIKLFSEKPNGEETV